MLKENTDLVMEYLKYDELNNIEISICVEISYILGKQHNIDKLNNIILNYAQDGILTFSMFVLYCYKEYCKGKYWSIYELLDDKLEEIIENFINKYFKGE